MWYLGIMPKKVIISFTALKRYRKVLYEIFKTLNTCHIAWHNL